MKLIYWIPLIFFTAVIGIIIFDRKEVDADYDLFAQCLTEKGFTMYGAEWCPHCKNEKNAFGDSFKYVEYVECPDNPKECLEKGINGYPTWITGEGEKLEGERGVEKLSEKSGCKLQN
ncbi:MAG: hypothetical protein A3J46_03895 [Candidatus Yanofskybacteria bacterium RIFCSPHIGHO2_02_FULL_41_11]|uniref:Thioredoxin domain-containing protein n=2 Tax=Candidatus Yanofskyibacteriota TaxID=1752733 RepID=A0A1F8F5Y9_9BACT|nr:MAG: hypothetical protein A2817_01095 [Candidatus Yanofskybacteria bacterium RIFCSPHIGHO2_01_FULL_39_8b]OGN08565.1 MAG: hypothetical protein A3J46_03895 [Candidatus Yanofskybacteria bacterium RIFCSPHIGHO2_02_FULL_41_11]